MSIRGKAAKFAKSRWIAIMRHVVSPRGIPHVRRLWMTAEERAEADREFREQFEEDSLARRIKEKLKEVRNEK